MKHLNKKFYAAAVAGLSLFGLVACGGSSPSSPVPVVVNGAGVAGYGVPITNTTCDAGNILMNGICTNATDFSSACYNTRGTLVQDASNHDLCKYTVFNSGSQTIFKPLFNSSPYLYSGAADNVGEYTGISVRQGDTIKVLTGYLSSISISGNSDLMLGLNDQVIDAEATKTLLAKNAGQIRIGVSTPNTKAGMHYQVEIDRCQTATAAYQCP